MSVKVATVALRFIYNAPDDEGEADERADAITDALLDALYAGGQRLVTLGVFRESFSIPDWDEEDETE